MYALDQYACILNAAVLLLITGVVAHSLSCHFSRSAFDKHFECTMLAFIGSSSKLQQHLKTSALIASFAKILGALGTN